MNEGAMKSILELSDVLVLPHHGRAIVARFASRYFVLVGHRDHAMREYDVLGPFELHVAAARHARLLQQHAYEDTSAHEQTKVCR